MSAATELSPTPIGQVLVVEDDDLTRRMIALTLERAGYDVTAVPDGLQALQSLREATPDLVLSDVNMPGLDGLGLLKELRADPALRNVPVVMLTAYGSTDDIVGAMNLGADDYLVKPFKAAELLARVQAKVLRPSVAREDLPRDNRTGLLNEAAFTRALARETERATLTGRPLCLAVVTIEELPRLRERFGQRFEAALARQLAARAGEHAGQLDAVGRDRDGRFLVLLPETTVDEARRRLTRLAERAVNRVFEVGSERIRLTPSTGFAEHQPDLSPKDLLDRALTALPYASSHLDLQPVLYDRARHGAATPARPTNRWQQFWDRNRLYWQSLLVLILAVAVPTLIYWVLDRAGLDITPYMYVAVVIALVLTATLIWVEGIAALNPTQPPADPASPHPPASAIIAAYLPNEAATVVETIEAFLRVDYPAPLQVILAYNTPRDLPIEATLREIAARDKRFLPLKVEGSTSKAQNVNAALAETTGEFTGVFDADHQPDPDSFRRAWRWLSNGYDVVQGHCVIRNGDESWVARLIAVEFESIYSVSHPGRARMHGFGIFGGSNGYWRTELLRRIRMHGFMLTEDIDSSLRAVEGGYRIASDPHLASRELAPTTLLALTNQRLRWAQGWFQVSLKHTPLALKSRHLTPRNKLGMMHLLAWREIYPVLSMQMFPIVLYWILRGDTLDFLVPIFVLTTLFTMSVGPGQTLFAWLRADPQIRQRGGWFLYYFVVASLFYTPFKNLLAMVAQVKEVLRERAWKVTPRSAKGESS
jgi:cellulose synthase/poly-beta-1,6-N-acetylglucosamine synthase-like glycosyltransferase/DNA-binding response OmpR family regulator